MSVPAADRPRGLAGALALPLVLAAALALRLYHLGLRSVWTDEGSTWTAATSTLAALVRRCAEREESPPLYYMLTSLPLRFGQDEVHLRLVSALASVALVWVAYRFARLAAGRGESVLAAGLLALSPFQVMYAQEARAYMLVALFTIGALYLFARAAIQGRPRAWLPYVAVSALGLWTQSIALLGVGTQAVLVLLLPEARRRLVPWLRAQVAIAALYVPWLVLSWGRGVSPGEGHWYIEAPGPHGLFQVLRAVFIAPLPIVNREPGSSWPGLAEWMPPPVAWLLLVAMIGVPLVVSLYDRNAAPSRRALRWTVLAALVLPPVAVLAASPWMPLWLPRFFVFLSVPMVLLLAHGLARLRPRVLAIAWSALILLVYAFGVLHYDRDYTKEDWRRVTREVAAASTPGRTAVFVLFDVDPFAFYNSKLPQPLPAIEISHAEVPLSGHLNARQHDEVEAGVRARAAGFDEVWVVRRSLSSESRREMTRRTDRAVGEGRTLIADRVWFAPGGTVYGRLFRR
jgi:4-amino-4-deoxy-L-arabinose transferase-like glycosyltransferase